MQKVITSTSAPLIFKLTMTLHPTPILKEDTFKCIDGQSADNQLTSSLPKGFHKQKCSKFNVDFNK